MLSRCLTSALKEKEDTVAEYFVTDISYALATSAAKSCSYSHAIPRTYDISKAAEEQRLTPGSFDVITAFSVLHVAADIVTTLKHLWNLLTPGGCLLVVDLDGSAWDASASSDQRAGTLWYDFVFGCFSEWHSYNDGRQKCTLCKQSLLRICSKAHDYYQQHQRNGNRSLQLLDSHTSNLQ